MKRLPPRAGEWLDRERRVTFTFEGSRVEGYAGDTITSAVLAAGHDLVGRSFKYHRPRGPLSLADHDVNALFQVRRDGRSIPNVRGDVTPVLDEWDVTAVNTLGGLAKDRMAVLDRLSRFLPVGFYYKAFHGKRFASWERLIRKTTGLGTIDRKAPPRSSAKRYDFTDVLVVGAGPSGLAAALAAAEAGASVLLVDENARLGGSGAYIVHDASALARTADLVSRVERHESIRVQLRTYAAGYYADHWVALATPDHLVKVRAKSVVVATGAHEQPAVFRGNDRPGVMLASGAQRLLARYAVAPASRVAVLTANAQGYGAALDALDAGLAVAGVFDLRARRGQESEVLAAALEARGVRTHVGATPTEAVARGKRVACFKVSVGGATKHVEVDGLWMSTGFAPADGLLRQAGATLAYDDERQQFLASEVPEGVFACGRVNGVYGYAGRLADGARAGTAAAAVAFSGARLPAPARPVEAEYPNHPYPIFPHEAGKEFVDFDEDLHLRDFANAVQEGFDSSELLKRYTTVGMGPSQGKHSNLNALRILAGLRGLPMSALAPTTSRPMVHPVPLALLAGRGFTPERRTPIDADHAALGAVWMPAGNWRRPEYYAVSGLDRAQAIRAEVAAVRGHVGLIDVGTLGKIEAWGPHAGEFLDRVYAGKFTTLKPGMTRYGLMLDESGVVIDDGVVARLAPDHYYFTTTTGNSATLYRELGRLATQWGLPVSLVNLTGHYAAFNLAGPLSRSVLAALTALDLSPDAFPYLAVRTATVAGVPCRLMRVGFVGELGYEIHMPATHAAQVWRALLDAGRSHGIRPFGVEAQRVLRLEKGHVIVGQDTDGLTHPAEIGADWAVKMDKAFFVGQRSLEIRASLPRRQQLVGFVLEPDEAGIVRESHLMIDRGEIAGRVTSIADSPTLGQRIGLALVAPSIAGQASCRIRGEGGREVEARIVSLPFYDPEGVRQKIVEGTTAAVAP